MTRIVVLKLPFRPSQREMINNWALETGIWYKFAKIGDSSGHTFRKFSRSPYENEESDNVQLFLGQNRWYTSWAFIKIVHKMQKRSAEVAFMNEYPNGYTVKVKDIRDLALMYPFHVFKKTVKYDSMSCLKNLILYIFLDAGLVEKVFSESLDTAKINLASIFERISKTYVDKGGTDAIPDIHPPFSITETCHNDDENTDDEQDAHFSAHTDKSIEAGNEEFLEPKSESHSSTPANLEDHNLQPRSERAIEHVLYEPLFQQEHRELTPITEPVAGTKRRAAGQTDFDLFQTIKRKREEGEREQMMLEHRLARLKARQEKFKEDMKELVKGKSNDEVIEWMLAPMSERDIGFGGIAETIREENDLN